MFQTTTPKLTVFDRLLFVALEQTSARKPLELRALLSRLTKCALGEVSQSLARLLLRGLIVELPGRRFYARIVASEPQGFTPLTVTEWAQAGA